MFAHSLDGHNVLSNLTRREGNTWGKKYSLSTAIKIHAIYTSIDNENDDADFLDYYTIQSAQL
jgi:hypothetical protein